MRRARSVSSGSCGGAARQVLCIDMDGGTRGAEMEVEEAKAERVLREHNGEAVAALRFLVNQ